MKIACLIFVHKNPDQLKQLIEILDCPEIDFYIHIDKKINRNIFNLENKNNIFYVKNNVRIKWATFSQVQATINSLSEIVNNKNYDYINFISGQDLPIKNKYEIVKFLEINKGTEFITCIPYSPFNDWWIENERRVFKFNFHNWIIPFKYKIQNFINYITPKRIPPDGYVIAGNASWFCITQECAKYILNSSSNNKRLIKFFQYVWGVDEFFFSTLVYNSPFKEKIKENITYVDWESPHNGHPKILTIDDFEKIKNSEKLFARKFDPDIDHKIINEIQNSL